MPVADLLHGATGQDQADAAIGNQEAECGQERIHPEIGNQHAVDQAEEGAGGERRDDRDGWRIVVGQEDDRGSEIGDRADREIDISGDQYQGQTRGSGQEEAGCDADLGPIAERQEGIRDDREPGAPRSASRR